MRSELGMDLFHKEQNSGKELNNIRMIALDMDGTLLKSDKTIHPDTLEDIRAASDRGIIVAYCTGRAVPELADFRDKLKEIRYGVCMSGALVYDFHEGRSIYKRPINDIHMKRILDVSKEDDAMVQILSDEESFVRADQVTHMADFYLKVYQPMFERVTTKLKSMDDIFKCGFPLLKANVHYHSTEARERAYDELKNLPLNIIFSETTTLEITAKGASKASGLKILAMCLGIPMEDIMGVGDGNNDRRMLESVGVSVAMGNAWQDLKEACDMVTEDNDNNGAGLAIRHVLNQRKA